MNKLKDKNSTEYNEDYLNWKGWNNKSFATLRKSRYRYFAKELTRTKTNFSKGSKVLEIGFGNGKFLQYAKLNGWDIYGTEANVDLVNLAKDRGFNAFCVDNLNQFDSDFFDLVVAFDVLEHIPQDQILYFLNDVKRVIKSGGVFIARFPNGDSPFGLSSQHGDITHVTTIGSNKIKYFCKKIGVELVYSGGEAEVIIGRNPISVIRRFIGFYLKMIINFSYYIFYFQRISFCSRNLVMIFRKV
jgi:2-polyprenyl-3-methyl-5-hydroxy-6-metoxy-1,4-benzoquinol methylase